ncbi:MAG: 6,7-dimethyl-8-ribityllumazine synthase [Bacteroidetes bacterium]|nr:6,7-dimethyl-8-ribityllumazine synthase [Bacteroidota bacterium]
MSSVQNNLSEVKGSKIPKNKNIKICIVWAEWNTEITSALKKGAIDFLKANGLSSANIKEYSVPGAFELVAASRQICYSKKFNAVISIGCVIRGGTPHFEYICQAVSIGLSQLNTQQNTPIIFGVLTTDNLQQAIDRAGGVHGNKGVEAAITALKMIDFNKKLKK